MLSKALAKDPDKMVRVQKACVSADLATIDSELDDLLA
jgi:hypothetical protein